MNAFSKPRLTRAALGLAAVSAFAFAPMAAQAADQTLTGTLNGGSLTNTAPTLAPAKSRSKRESDCVARATSVTVPSIDCVGADVA